MALVPTLAPDPGADIAAQAQLMRQQKLAQLLANPPAAPEIDMGGDGGGKGDKGSSPEGNSILAKALSEDVAKTAGPSVASFDAPASSAASFVTPSSQSSSPVHLGNVNMAERIYNSLRSNGASHAEAIMLTGAANSESSFNPRAIHDGGIGYGMFGHNGRRLAAMRAQFGPNPTAEQQALFALQEARQRGDIPSGATPEQIAAAQMSFERPRGWRPGHPELGDNYGGRLNTIRAYLNRFGGGGSPAPAANPVASAPMAAAPEAPPAPYKVASLGYTPAPRRQPIAPMQPAPAPAPAPTATPPVPPIPTMVGAPMPTNATPISPTAGASLTDAPLPPSRSASGVDDMIKRQAASARPAFTEPEGFDLFDEIGRGLEELFGGGGDTGGGGPSPQQLGTQLASAGEEYYPMPPSNSHGILGLISDAFREPVPIPQEVRALANSPKQSDRLAYQLMVHGDQLGGTQSSMLTALYKEAREREQAQQNRLGEPFRDQYGNLVQIGPNGEYNIRQAAEKPQARQTATVDGNVIDTQTGQVIYSAPQKPQTPVHVGDALVDPTTGREVYRAPAKPDESSMRIQNEVAAREQELRRRGLDPNEARNRDWVLTGKFPREDATPLTATDKKAILEADEMVETSQNALTAIQRAKEASKKAWGFKGAGPISALTAPFSEGAQNTVDLDNIVTSDALESLKATFGGNPTEGERAILLQIQGSSALPDAERQRIYDRAAAAIQRRLEFNKRRAQDMRGGSYYDQGHNPNNQGPAAGAQPSSGASPAPAKRLRYDANGNIIQ